MKKMFYVLLSLLVSMVLVFGVSCDNSNKTPGGVDLGTDAVRVPKWAVGSYTQKLEEDATGQPAKLSISEDGNFNITGMLGFINMDESKVSDITSQIDYQNKYELMATFDTGMLEPQTGTLIVSQERSDILNVSFILNESIQPSFVFEKDTI